MANPTTAPIEKSFCTTQETAALLGVSVGTVQLWVDNGLLQAWKTAGGHRRVMRESVNRLLHQKPDQPSAEATPDRHATDLRRLRIMVVEDDPALLRLYEATMSRWPMAPEIIAVDNAAIALLMMGRSCPDLLLMDLQMPGMNGFRMLHTMRVTPEIARATIVVVSGLDLAEIDTHGGIPAGIEVLPKPIPFNRLLAIATGIVNQIRFQMPLV